jgi:hypothetical protein
VVAACAVLAAAGATAASAPEPRAAKRALDLQSRRELVVPWLAHQPESRVIRSKARAALALETSAGPVSLWVAPTRDGGSCYLVDIPALPVENAGALCSARPFRADYAVRPWHTETWVGDGYLRLLGARVTPEVASVEVRFADGTSDALRPAGGFVLRELGAEEEPVLVIARDEHGAELRRRELPGPRSVRRDLPFPIGDYRKVIELETSAGYPLTFAVAPGTNASVCGRIFYRGAQDWSCGLGPSRLEPHAVSVHLRKWKDLVLLEGSVGRAISRLEAWYADGGAGRLPIGEQYVLFELPRGRTPRVLVGLDSSGAIVARRAID